MIKSENYAHREAQYEWLGVTHHQFFLFLELFLTIKFVAKINAINTSADPFNIHQNHCLAHELSPQPHCLDFNSQKIIKNIAPPSKDHKRRAKNISDLKQ